MSKRQGAVKNKTKNNTNLDSMRGIAPSRSVVARVLLQPPKPVQSNCDTAKFGKGSPELFKSV